MGTSERDLPRLAVGDECWLFHGTLLYEVKIMEVRVCLEGDPNEFVMYRVDAWHGIYSFINESTHHRSDLFRRPTEVEYLRKRIESDLQSLNYVLNELEDVGSAEDPENAV